jgi:ABC-type Mn2+/Zn2+ transport system ATPase subunit
MYSVEVEGLTVRYGDVVAISGVSFSVPPGRMVALLGPNGAGKTSLLKAIAGLVEPASGSIRVFGEPLGRARGRIAYIPQREEVYWDYPLTVRDLVALGRIRAYGRFRPIPHRDPVVDEALRMVNMDGLAQRRISELSGGQQQRAFIARAIAQGGEVYLLDEALAGLDAVAEDTLLEILAALRDSGRTIIMSTHDISTTLEAFDYVLILRNTPVAFGPPKAILTPENLARAYGSERVGMHLSDVKGVAGWT